MNHPRSSPAQSAHPSLLNHIPQQNAYSEIAANSAMRSIRQALPACGELRRVAIWENSMSTIADNFLFRLSWYSRRGGIWNPFIEFFPAFSATAVGRRSPRRLFVLPAHLLTIEVNQANNSQTMENPCHRIAISARSEPLKRAIVGFRMIDDVAPVFPTRAPSHATPLPGRAGMTNENIAGECG
jgi:hypothetical protein